MIYIDWMLGWGNLPTIELHVENRAEEFMLNPRAMCEFEFDIGIWWHVQDNGLVQYFSHDGSDRNLGGFGGASFEVLHGGQPVRLIGPWSSRATCVEQVSGIRVADVVLRQHSTAPGLRTGILLDKLIELWDHPTAFLVREVRDESKEPGPCTASISRDTIRKADGTECERKYPIEVLAP